jgi:hypothetical protein
MGRQVLHIRLALYSKSLRTKHTVKSIKNTRDPQINSKGSTNIVFEIL